MGIDLQLLQADKGGDLAAVKLSQERRGASVELVDETLRLYKEWTKSEPVLPSALGRGPLEESGSRSSRLTNTFLSMIVNFNRDQVAKASNLVKKEIGTKMKVRPRCRLKHALSSRC